MLQTLGLVAIATATAPVDLLLVIRGQASRVIRDEVPVRAHFKTRGDQRLDLRPTPLPGIHDILCIVQLGFVDPAILVQIQKSLFGAIAVRENPPELLDLLELAKREVHRAALRNRMRHPHARRQDVNRLRAIGRDILDFCGIVILVQGKEVFRLWHLGVRAPAQPAQTHVHHNALELHLVLEVDRVLARHHPDAWVVELAVIPVD